MKAFAVYATGKTVTCHESYMDFASHVDAAINNNNHYPPRAAPEILKDHSFQFVALAHELRNPLTDINLSVGMIESIIDNVDLKTYLDIIMRSSIRMNDLITELLKYQQVDRAGAEKYSVHQLLDEVLEMASDRIAIKNIVVRKDYAAQDCTIGVNRLRMKIALTNILINAIDAMTSNKGELKLVTRSTGDKYIIQIEDNGCGISKRDLKNIFKPYFTNKPGGLGIGLSTTYEILQANNIGMNVESVEGSGTRFILLFDKNHQHKPAGEQQSFLPAA